MLNLSSSIKLLFFFSLVSFNSACSVQKIPLQTIYSSNNCAISEQRLASINSAAELDQLLLSFPKNFSKFPAISEHVDYRRQSLILFALGQKPSAGYSIQLKRNVARIKGQELFLPVSIQQPDASSYQAQLITSPCQIFSIPKTDFSKIRIDDN